MPARDYKILSRAGQGAQGVVYKALYIPSNELVAIKQIDISCLNEKEKNAAIAEITILSKLTETPHPNVMSYRESYVDVEDGLLCIVLEWCADGSLQDLYNKRHESDSTTTTTRATTSSGTRNSKQQQPQGFGEEEVWHYFLSICLALHHCHQLRIFHRDLKLANVFLHVQNKEAPYATCVLGDFGVSCILTDKSKAQTVVGTPYYLSPELCMGKPYTAKSDVWALGVVLFVLCNNKMPFQAANYAALILQIVQKEHDRHVKDSTLSPTLHRMATWCMQKNDQNRPTSRQILEHPDCVRMAKYLGLKLPEGINQAVHLPRVAMKNRPQAGGAAKAPAQRAITTTSEEKEEQAHGDSSGDVLVVSGAGPLPLPRKGTEVKGAVGNKKVRNRAFMQPQQPDPNASGCEPRAISRQGGTRSAIPAATHHHHHHGHLHSNSNKHSLHPRHPQGNPHKRSGEGAGSGGASLLSETTPRRAHTAKTTKRDIQSVADLPSYGGSSDDDDGDANSDERDEGSVARSDSSPTQAAAAAGAGAGASPTSWQDRMSSAAIRKNNELHQRQSTDKIIKKPLDRRDDPSATTTVTSTATSIISFPHVEEEENGVFEENEEYEEEDEEEREEEEEPLPGQQMHITWKVDGQAEGTLKATQHTYLSTDVAASASYVQPSFREHRNDTGAEDDVVVMGDDQEEEGANGCGDGGDSFAPDDTNVSKCSVATAQEEMEDAELRLHRLCEEGEALVGGAAVFAELVEILTRDSAIGSEQLRDFVSQRVPKAASIHDVMYLCFRYVFIKGEHLRMMSSLGTHQQQQPQQPQLE